MKSVPTVDHLCTLRQKIVPVLEQVLKTYDTKSFYETGLHVETYVQRLKAYEKLVECLNTEFSNTPKDDNYVIDLSWELLKLRGEEDSARNMNWSSVPSLAKYHPEKDVSWLYFHKSNLIWIPGNKPVCENSCLAGLTHELVHVFQYNSFPEFGIQVITTVKENNKNGLHKALKTLQEGHASLVTALVGEKLGFTPSQAYERETAVVKKIGFEETRLFFSHPELLNNNHVQENILQCLT